MNVEDVDGKENKREKGVNKNAVKNTEHEDYIEFLFNKKVTRHNMKRIPSKLHRNGTYDVCKIPLPCFEIKDIYSMMALILWVILIKIKYWSQ